MKRGLFILACVAPQAFADNGINPGSSFTSGPVSNHFSIFAAANNPAMAPLMTGEEEKWRINYLPAISFAAEVGDVNNFADEIDEIIDLIEDPSSNTDGIDETLDRLNNVLVELGEHGYIKSDVYVSVPVTPLYYYSEDLEGTFFVDLGISTQVNMRVLDEPLFPNDQNGSVTTDTSAYMKSGIEKKLSFGYGQLLLDDKEFLSTPGKLYLGGQLNLYQVELSKQIMRLEDLDGEEIRDVIRDEYDTNLVSTNGFSIDLGVVWDADKYRLGMRLDNINSPEFDYGAVGVNCSDRPDNTIERNSCEISHYFVDQGRLKSDETHTKHAVIGVDGLYKINERLFISSSLELAPYDDLVGDENQWFTLAMSYETKGFIPATRIGYRNNLAGTKLSTFTFGMTLFKSISLDFEWSPETIEIDGETGPRRAGFALAFEEKF